MPRLFLAGALCLWAGLAAAQSPVTITVENRNASAAIPDDFLGLSFEMQNVLADSRGGRIFTPENKPLANLFRTLGVKSIRVGGNMADRPTVPMPGPADIDSLFGFAQAAGARVIYTLRLREGDPKADASAAQYIVQHDQPLLDCFAIGNEPDYYRKVYPAISNYSSYSAQWKTFAQAILAAVPGAKFCGPCAGGYNMWSRQFTDEFASSGLVKFIAQHDYPGGGSRRAPSPQQACQAMLSPEWLGRYGKLYSGFGSNALAKGMDYRIEEANNYSDGGATNASDAFASALWSLEYAHWWAEHGAAGINIHGRRGVRNAVLHPLPVGGGWNINPVGYGLLAFNVGGHGNPAPISVNNRDGLNLTAYAVRGTNDAFVTILNKEDFPANRDASVTVVGEGSPGPASVMFLAAKDYGLAAKTGITLGGAPVNDDGSWSGAWSPLAPGADGRCVVIVPASSAAIVKFPARQK